MSIPAALSSACAGAHVPLFSGHSRGGRAAARAGRLAVSPHPGRPISICGRGTPVLLAHVYGAPARHPSRAISTASAGASGGAVAAEDLVAVDDATVLVTREAGKNGKLVKKLTELSIRCLELPLIEHGTGEDRESLPAILSSESFEWVCVTSPEAAAVFLQGWEEAGRPPVHIASVGAATAKIIEDAGLEVEFTPSKATAAVLAKEIPLRSGERGGQVLYPASAKAGTDLQEGLAERGFHVIRLNTYTTQAVSSVDPGVLDAAKRAGVIAVGSPSAAKAWLKLVGVEGRKTKAACIGGTSAKACDKLGMEQVFFPESPGIDGWVTTIVSALEA